jgi:hypothetical protein
VSQYSARSLKPTPQSILNNFFSFQFFSILFSPVSISARDTFNTDEFLDGVETEGSKNSSLRFTRKRKTIRWIRLSQPIELVELRRNPLRKSKSDPYNFSHSPLGTHGHLLYSRSFTVLTVIYCTHGHLLNSRSFTVLTYILLYYIGFSTFCMDTYILLYNIGFSTYCMEHVHSTVLLRSGN